MLPRFKNGFKNWTSESESHTLEAESKSESQGSSLCQSHCIWWLKSESELSALYIEFSSLSPSRESYKSAKKGNIATMLH